MPVICQTLEPGTGDSKINKIQSLLLCCLQLRWDRQENRSTKLQYYMHSDRFEQNTEGQGSFFPSAFKESFLEGVTFELAHAGGMLAPWEQRLFFVLCSVLVPRRGPGSCMCSANFVWMNESSGGKKEIWGIRNNVCIRHRVASFFTGKCLNCTLESFASYYRGHVSYFSLGKPSETLGMFCHFWDVDKRTSDVHEFSIGDLQDRKLCSLCGPREGPHCQGHMHGTLRLMSKH